MKISSFESLNGRTWVVSECYCVLGYFKSLTDARRHRVELYLARKRKPKPTKTEAATYNLFGELVRC